MKFITKTLSVFIAFIALTACAITHQYGPYMGKVVDKETGEPIEGAVVFLRFFTEYGTCGGGVSVFADAFEVMTDKDGEFNIPSHKVWVLRPANYWDPYAPAIIFKPGYGAYSGHPGVEPKFSLAGALPENQYVVIKLPKLKTREERMENLNNAEAYSISTIPYKNQKILLEYINKENVEVGLQPIGTKKARE